MGATLAIGMGEDADRGEDPDHQLEDELLGPGRLHDGSLAAIA